jgi:hypothetical protein
MPSPKMAFAMSSAEALVLMVNSLAIGIARSP